MSPFEELLSDLGKRLHLNLRLDHQHACSIQIHGRLIVQLQLDTSLENVWVFSKLTEIPPGKFRENILKEALKTNALPDPRNGILAYIASHNQLALYLKFPLNILNAERLVGVLGAFIEMAESWQQAIQNGLSAPTHLEPK